MRSRAIELEASGSWLVASPVAAISVEERVLPR
jgi:hypothetical protein